MNDEATIAVILQVTQIVPDGEPYKPSAPVIIVDMKIQIDVPLKDDLVKNADFIISARKLAKHEPEPVFTVKGLRFVEKALLARQEKEKTDPNDIDWSEDETFTNKKTNTNTSTDTTKVKVQWSDDTEEEFEF